MDIFAFLFKMVENEITLMRKDYIVHGQWFILQNFKMQPLEQMLVMGWLTWHSF